MSTVDHEFTGVLTEAPDGTTLPAVMLVDRSGIFLELTCANCGRFVSFVNASPQRVQCFATTHRCGGSTWQGTCETSA